MRASNVAFQIGYFFHIINTARIDDDENTANLAHGTQKHQQSQRQHRVRTGSSVGIHCLARTQGRSEARGSSQAISALQSASDPGPFPNCLHKGLAHVHCVRVALSGQMATVQDVHMREEEMELDALNVCWCFNFHSILLVP